METFLLEAANEIEANIIESMLAEHNIPVIKRPNESGSYMNVAMGFSIFGIKLYVSRDDFEIAQSLIQRTSENATPDNSHDYGAKEEVKQQAPILNGKTQRTIGRFVVWMYLLPGVFFLLLAAAFFFDDVVALIK